MPSSAVLLGGLGGEELHHRGLAAEHAIGVLVERSLADAEHEGSVSAGASGLRALEADEVGGARDLELLLGELGDGAEHGQGRRLIGLFLSKRFTGFALIADAAIALLAHSTVARSLAAAHHRQVYRRWGLRKAKRPGARLHCESRRGRRPRSGGDARRRRARSPGPCRSRSRQTPSPHPPTTPG